MIKDNQQYNEKVKSNTAFLNELKQNLPDFFTVSKYDEDGNLVEEGKFDNEKFQQALKEQNINEMTSGYTLEFIGKNYARKQTGERSTTVVVPDNEHNEKVENEKSKNLFFTGDNLEVLRHLQQNYANTVDFIYIDPPYNTGSDGFVYPDNFEYSDEQLVNMFGLNDEELSRLKSIQGKASHSAWLTFMYPRLYLAKKLLTDTGVIFVSIDDHEQANLKLLMDDVFGEGSFTVQFIWAKTSTPPALSNKARSTTEYILVYEKNSHTTKYFGSPLDNGTVSLLNGSNTEKEIIIPKDSAKFGFIDNGIVKKNKFNRVHLLDDIKIKNGKNSNDFRISAQVRWSQTKLDDEVNKGTFFTFNSASMNPRFQRTNSNNYKTPNTALYKELGVDTNEEAVRYLSKLGLKNLFDYPKPVSLIQYLINMITFSKPDALILDFFAGSATTADAVMKLNAEDGGHRKYIMVQLPENIKPDSPAYKAGYKTIDQISRDRIKKAADKLKSDNPVLTEKQDLGFKHYRVVEANQQALDKIDFNDEIQLDMFDDMISLFSSENLGIEGNASGFDTILQTYLVKDNYKFDVPIEKIDFAGVALPYVNDHRIYLISDTWNAENTKALINKIGTNEISVQTIVVYGYTIEMESLRELEIALNQLENKVNLIVRY